MSRFSDIAIIYNPNSTGDAPSNATELKDKLLTALPGIPVSLLPTERAGHARSLAYDFARSHTAPLVIVASGDGGYNEVINGALQAQAEGADPVCAVLPSGNANDHARTLQERPLAELISAETVTRLDVLKLSALTPGGDEVERYAHSYIGLGLTPTVALQLNKHKLSRFKETVIVVRALWRLQPVRLRLDDQTMRVDSLICSTIPEMAKVLTLSKDAQPQDGLFELTLHAHVGKLRLVLWLLRGLIGQLGEHTRAQSVDVTLLEDAALQLDGEIERLPVDSKVRIFLERQLLQTLV